MKMRILIIAGLIILLLIIIGTCARFIIRSDSPFFSADCRQDDKVDVDALRPHSVYSFFWLSRYTRDRAAHDIDDELRLF